MTKEYEINELIDSFIQKTKLSVSHGYGNFPIPNDLDWEVAKIVDLFIDVEPDQRKFIISSFDFQKGRIFAAFAVRMAAYAVRTRNEEFIFKGLVAIAIEDFKDMMTFEDLAPLYHSAKKIKANPKKLFNEAAQYASCAEVSDYFKGFVKRRDLKNILKTMGFKESSDEDGFRYEVARNS